MTNYKDQVEYENQELVINGRFHLSKYFISKSGLEIITLHEEKQ